MSYIEQILEAASPPPMKNTSCTATYIPNLNPSKLKEQNMGETGAEVRMNPLATFSYGPLHTEEQVLDDQLELQQLCADTGCSLEDLLEAMDDRDEWQKGVREIRACGMT